METDRLELIRIIFSATTDIREDLQTIIETTDLAISSADAIKCQSNLIQSACSRLQDMTRTLRANSKCREGDE